MPRTFSRRDVLKASTALALTLPAMPLRAAAPAAEPVTPALIAAAQKEGKVVYYTSIDLPLAEKIAKSFEAKYPGIAVRVERTGAERVFQRVGQEYGSRIYAVDVVNSSDAAHFIAWTRDGILQPYVPEDVAKFYPPEHKNADGLYASFRVGLSVVGYNTGLVKAEEAPKSFADLLDPKWTGKMVKAHPGYSGNVMSATFQVTRDLGWEYLEKLAKQKIMQVQSSTDPPKKLALGERAVMVDGNEYNALILKEAGQPVEVVYPSEGTPMAVGPNAIFKNAPNPNAARLLQSYMFTPECQQLVIDVGALRSVHPQAKEHAGRKPFKDIKVMKDDAAGVEKNAQDIKARYSKIFGVLSMKTKFTRRDVLKAGTALTAATVFAEPIRAAAPPAEAVTPALIEAAKKEGKVVHYTSVDLPLAEKVAKAFEAKYPGIAVRTERTGAERVFTRIAQERGSNIHACDVVQSSDAAHFVVWKREGILAPYVPEEVAQHYPAEHKDPDGLFASYRVYLCVMARNTDLVKAEDAPKSYKDLLDPKWAGKIVKAHPGYSGTILTATQQTARDVGWDYFERLAKQRVMQVQSASDPPKKLALGERAIMADGIEYGVFQLKETGKPVDVIYPSEGSPLIIGPNGILKSAPNPNAARLFQTFMLSAECQQFNVDLGGLRSAHGLVKDKPGRTPMKDIKVLKDDAAAVERDSEQIKARYSQYFKV